jgi:hypothetical protein
LLFSPASPAYCSHPLLRPTVVTCSSGFCLLGVFALASALAVNTTLR